MKFITGKLLSNNVTELMTSQKKYGSKGKIGGKKEKKKKTGNTRFIQALTPNSK